MKLISLTILVAAFLTSCIKDTPKNPEADIELFSIDESQITSGVVIDQAGRKILLYLTPLAFQTGVKPVLKLSHGATAVPESGDSIHFDKPVLYTITSETGTNKKVYTVEVVEIGNWTFNFDQWGQHPDDKYEFPLEDNNVQIWSSGNPGIALAGVERRPDAYPGRQTADGYNGSKAAEVLTIEGTPLSLFLNIRLFAGSFYLGNFNSGVALSDPTSAPEFGEPYFGLPERFTGYYKYTPGPNFQDVDGVILPAETDKHSLYAVLYNGPDRLNGSNVNTSDSVVARAVVPADRAPNAFERFDLPFTFIPGRVARNNLMLAIVASPSYQGDQYRGAIGSRLVIDSLRIIPQ